MKKNAIFLLFVLIVLFPVMAVNITGTVKSGAGGLEGVRVKLGKANLMTTTGPDGTFTLTDNTGMHYAAHRTNEMAGYPFSVKNDRLVFNATEQMEATVTAFDCNGKLLAARKKAVAPGNDEIALPHFGTGVRLYRIFVNNRQFTFTAVAGTASNGGQALPRTETGLARQAKASARIDDALMFIKQGYQYSRVVVKNPDTAGVLVTMKPLDTGTLTDAEGNVYRTVKIGNQYWTAENLRSTKYTDGSNIGNACTFYGNTTDAAAKKKWGALYTDAAAKSSKIAPTGWRVPTGADWDALVNYLITNGYNYDGTTKTDKVAKALAAATDWPPSTDSGAIGNDLTLNNASGFSALPAGWKFWDGKFEKQTTGGYWWIAGGGSANVCDLWWIFCSLDRYSTIQVACSIRLVKNS
jgi:uncharacterized protein (TIGR02145 family)